VSGFKEANPHDYDELEKDMQKARLFGAPEQPVRKL
jgi:hypothetical protein